MLRTLKDALKGKKAYLLSLAALAYAIGGYYTGNLDADASMKLVWEALTAAAIRAGITNAVKGTEDPITK